MANPRYIPRSFAVTPSRFGDPGRPLEWRGVGVGIDDVPVAAEDWLRAAQIQDQFARRIRKRVGTSVKEFTEVNEMNYKRFTQMLRGEIVMKLEDVAMAERLLGIKAAWQLTLESELTAQRDLEQRRSLAQDPTD
jgi:hypothetical protein